MKQFCPDLRYLTLSKIWVKDRKIYLIFHCFQAVKLVSLKDIGTRKSYLFFPLKWIYKSDLKGNIGVLDRDLEGSLELRQALGGWLGGFHSR